jgi:hypothetical protein
MGTMAGRQDWVVFSWRDPSDASVVLRRERTRRAARRWVAHYLIDLDDGAVAVAIVHVDTVRAGRDLTPRYPSP